jgi:hypothetical protein
MELESSGCFELAVKSPKRQAARRRWELEISYSQILQKELHSCTTNSPTKYEIVKSVMDTVITSRVMGLEEHVVWTREKRNESKILVGKSQRKRSTERRRCILVDNMILDFRTKKGGVGVTWKKQLLSEITPTSCTCFLLNLAELRFS